MAVEEGDESSTLLEVLELEQLDRDLYRTCRIFPEPIPLYGGLVAAQALLAAGGTVDPDRLPHSLHGYFLRGGDTALPTIFRVERDRDGRSYSARRVVAVQGGEVVFNMSCSFQVEQEGPDAQADDMGDVGDPETLPVVDLPRLRSIEARLPDPPYADAPWPTLFWARTTIPLPTDQLTHACVLTYLSDISTGLAAWPGAPGLSGSSLDHAVWFHRPVRMDDWVLTRLVPSTVARGRGWYTGTVHDRQGRLVASLTQESLFRVPRNP